ncbi:lysophospholipid acyltransferase family protein [Leptothermofonsia sp. ETS-13]|uniref:lysophospholipid acyltransferase family protein n=1 Tax=Leptothermofonsia sp. ETS-13 TaxID=3035696 RepID=UPI003B9FB4D8
MSPFDFMTPLETTVQRSSRSNRQSSNSSQAQVHPSELGRIYWQSLIVNAAKFSVRARSSTAASLRPAQFLPWLASLVYRLGRYIVIPAYFKSIEVTGREHVPLSGPVILAPTHRSRWDAFLVPYAVGHDITGRHLHFMVSADEVVGCQGWLIRHLGGFPVDTRRPGVASLRHGVELLKAGKMLVIFPEGDIFRGDEVQPLKPGLARLALQAETIQPGLEIQIIPIHLHYSHPMVPWKSRVKIQIGAPLRVANYHLGAPKIDAQQLTSGLLESLRELANTSSI